MNSYRISGTVLSAIIFALISSNANAMDRHESAAYRLIMNNDEEAPPPAPENLQEVPSNDIGSGEDSYRGKGIFNQGGNSDCGWNGKSCYAGCGDEGCGYSPACCCPRWTITADAIIFDRIGTKHRQLVNETNQDLPTDGVLLSSENFNQGFRGGPRVSLIRHGDRCFDLEVLYFQIDGWKSSKVVRPDGEDGRGIGFSAPDFIVRSYVDPYQWDYASKLYNGEFNVRWNPSCRVTLLAGFRWAELREDLNGGILSPLFESFWDTSTQNDLYGFQIGAEAILFQRCRFSIDGLLKAGIYGNHAQQLSSGTDYEYGFARGSASTNRTAFLGQVGLQCKYQVTDCLTFRAGYEAMWIDGVALAPGQIDVTNLYTNEIGIDTNGSVFLHGATVGFEYSF
jgi:hypothetical protein